MDSTLVVALMEGELSECTCLWVFDFPKRGKNQYISKYGFNGYQTIYSKDLEEDIQARMARVYIDDPQYSWDKAL